MNLGPVEIVIILMILAVALLPVAVVVLIVIARGRHRPQDAEVLPTVGAQLKELAELRDQGVLSEAEFEAQKARLLG